MKVTSSQMEQEDKSKSLNEQGQEAADKCARSSVGEGNGQDAGLTEDAASDAYMSELGDIGNVDLPDIDLGLLDFLPSDEMEETRYMLPHVAHYDPETFVVYDNAEKLARELRITDNMRADAFIAGSFIFGDFIEAFMTTNHAITPKMTISTLSMSQENVDSLHNLMEAGFIKELNLIISVYFWAHERNGLLPYIYEQLDIDDRFQLAVAGMQPRPATFKRSGERRSVSMARQTCAPPAPSKNSSSKRTPAFMTSSKSNWVRLSRNTRRLTSPSETAMPGIYSPGSTSKIRAQSPTE